MRSYFYFLSTKGDKWLVPLFGFVLSTLLGEAAVCLFQSSSSPHMALVSRLSLLAGMALFSLLLVCEWCRLMPLFGMFSLGQLNIYKCYLNDSSSHLKNQSVAFFKNIHCIIRSYKRKKAIDSFLSFSITTENSVKKPSPTKSSIQITKERQGLTFCHPTLDFPLHFLREVPTGLKLSNKRPTF